MEKPPCKNTFDMAVGIVIHAIREKIEEGRLTPDMLTEIENALTTNNNKVEAFCHSVHERCMKKSKLDLLIPPRTNAYGRVMVQPLEMLLDKKHRRFSEKQLANYFHMLSTILGREIYEGYHNTLSSLITDEIRDKGSNFSWDLFYKHETVIDIRIKTLGAIAQAFESFEKRMNWFVNVMESSVEKPNDGDGTMQFTEHQAKDFLLALFGECINMSDTKKQQLEHILDKKRRKGIAALIIKAEKMK